MLRRLAGPMLGILVLAVAGCAGSTATSGGANLSGPLAQAGGAWSGYAGVGATSLPVSLNLKQTGSNVSGDLNLGGRPDFTGPVAGTVQGNVLTLKLTNGTSTLPTMTVGQNQITAITQFGPMTLQRAR